jgi:uncharacterized Zn-binding protein involved in type VI secretion
MSRPLICMGDRTSHGGTVISGDMTWDINGKAVARVGDSTVCPKCKGIFPITTGAEDTTGFGQAVARDGDKTACGATLIAGQATTLWDQHITQNKASPVPAESLQTAGRAIAREAPTICLDCLAKAAAAGSAMVVRS